MRPLMQIAAPIRHHLTFIVALAAIGTLIYSISVVSTIISISDDQAYREEQLQNRVKSRFDLDTIGKINALSSSSERTPVSLSPGRNNPFVN